MSGPAVGPQSDVVSSTPVGGGDTCTASRLVLADGTVRFAKQRRSPPGKGASPAGPAGTLCSLRRRPGCAGSERREGKRRRAGPRSGRGLRGNAWCCSGSSRAGRRRAAAERFGRELARTHRAGATRVRRSLGRRHRAAAPRQPAAGIGSRTPVGLRSTRRRRIEPYLALAVDARSIDEDDRRAVEGVVARIDELCGPDEPPARIHGDLWSGNLVWAAEGRVWLVDPAAHGGHRETDLAMLALFGTPHLDRVLDAYAEEWALAPGHREPGGPPPAPPPARPRRPVRRSLRCPGRRGGPLRPRRERGLSATPEAPAEDGPGTRWTGRSRPSAWPTVAGPSSSPCEVVSSEKP